MRKITTIFPSRKYPISYRRLICLVVSLLAYFCPSAMSDHSIDSLRAILATAKTPADSLPVMFNIYDCVYFDERKHIVDQIYETAVRSGLEKPQLEILFLMTALYEDDHERRDLIIQRLESMPASEAQKAMLMYAKLRFASRVIKSLPEELRVHNLMESLSRYKESVKLGIYDRIEYLFMVCSYMRLSNDGPMLRKYLTELQQLVDSLPSCALALRSLIYSQSAINFLHIGLEEEALEANRKMLEIIHEFDKKHEAEGRIFRNYSGSIYLCYHRMLMCHNLLTKDEIEHYYDIMTELAETNPRLHINNHLRNRSKAFYLMANKRYDEALPLLREQLDSIANTESYRYTIESYIDAASQLNRTDDLLISHRLYNDLLKERLNYKAYVSFKELQTLYEVISLKKENKDLLAEGAALESDKSYFVVILFVSGVVLLLLVVWLLTTYFRARKLGKHLMTVQQQLIKERNALADTKSSLVKTRDKAKASERIRSDIVNNFSKEIRRPLNAIVEYSRLICDFADEDPRPYIHGFSDHISRNTELLLAIVNDVLEVSSLERNTHTVQRIPTSIQKICSLPLELIQKHLAPGVKLTFTNEDDNDELIKTDPQRVQQVLVNLLSNAAKFTQEGEITLSYIIAADHKTVTFTVTDTGIGIPRGKEEAIFNRFVKLDPTAQGNGLGLYISRLTVKLLNGQLKLDSSYRKGARFKFTLPIK